MLLCWAMRTTPAIACGVAELAFLLVAGMLMLPRRAVRTTSAEAGGIAITTLAHA